MRVNAVIALRCHPCDPAKRRPGAIGMEVPGAYVRAEYGSDTIAYAVMTTIEESMEMLGAVVFLYAMALYAERAHGQVPPRPRYRSA